MSFTPREARYQRYIENANRELKEQGGSTKTDFGELLRTSPAFQDYVDKKYGLDCPDDGQLQANWIKFKRTSDFRRMTTYKNRFI